MNYVELASKYNITSIDDAFEKLIGSDLSRSERMKVIKTLRWSYRYMRNTCFRIIKDASFKELISHVFDRELVPSSVLAKRDKYEFKRLTRFEFVDKFVEWYKDSFNANIWNFDYYINNANSDALYERLQKDKNIRCSAVLLQIIMYLVHMVNHITDFSSEGIACLYDEPEIIKELKEIRYKDRDKYVNDLFICSYKNLIEWFSDPSLSENAIDFLTHEIDYIEYLINKGVKYLNEYTRWLTYKKNVLGIINESNAKDYWISYYDGVCKDIDISDLWDMDYKLISLDTYDKYTDSGRRCLHFNEPNIDVVHNMSFGIAVEVYNKLPSNNIFTIVDFKKAVPEYIFETRCNYRANINYNFPFFYGDEYLLKLCDNEETIKKYLYDEMYKRIVKSLS